MTSVISPPATPRAAGWGGVALIRHRHDETRQSGWRGPSTALPCRDDPARTTVPVLSSSAPVGTGTSHRGSSSLRTRGTDGGPWERPGTQECLPRDGVESYVMRPSSRRWMLLRCRRSSAQVSRKGSAFIRRAACAVGARGAWLRRSPAGVPGRPARSGGIPARKARSASCRVRRVPRTRLRSYGRRRCTLRAPHASRWRRIRSVG